MTDKTDLIEQIKLHVGFMKAADNPVSDHYHLKEIKRLFIEQACEIASDLDVPLGLSRHEITAFNKGVDALQQAIREKFSE